MLRGLRSQLAAGPDPGEAKALCNFESSGAVSIQSSRNVKALTDNGVGIYKLEWAIPFKTPTYVAGGVATLTGTAYRGLSPDTPAKDQLPEIRVVDGAGANRDADEIMIWAFGELENE